MQYINVNSAILFLRNLWALKRALKIYSWCLLTTWCGICPCKAAFEHQAVKRKGLEDVRNRTCCCHLRRVFQLKKFRWSSCNHLVWSSLEERGSRVGSSRSASQTVGQKRLFFFRRWDPGQHGAVGSGWLEGCRLPVVASSEVDECGRVVGLHWQWCPATTRLLEGGWREGGRSSPSLPLPSSSTPQPGLNKNSKSRLIAPHTYLSRDASPNLKFYSPQKRPC